MRNSSRTDLRTMAGCRPPATVRGPIRTHRPRAKRRKALTNAGDNAYSTFKQGHLPEWWSRPLVCALILLHLHPAAFFCGPAKVLRLALAGDAGFQNGIVF